MPSPVERVVDSEIASLLEDAIERAERRRARAQELEQQRAADAKEWRDPLEWAESRGWDPWEGQRRMMRAAGRYRRLCIVGSNGIGKGNFLAWRTYHWLRHPHRRPRAMTSANTNDQVRENTWHEINKLHRRHDWPGECLTQSWKLEDGAKAVGYTTDVEQALQGKHEEAFLLEVDESSGERLDDSWPIYKTLVSGDGQIILVGNLDRRSGIFAEASEGKYGFHVVRVTSIEAADFQLQHGRVPGVTTWENIAQWANDLDAPVPGLQEWASQQMDPDDDLPPLPEELLEDVREWATEGWKDAPVQVRNWWRIHVLAMKPETEEGGWFSESLLEAACERDPAPGTGPWRIGLDVAGEGEDGDWTKAYGRRGDHCRKIGQWRGETHASIFADLMAWAEEIRRHEQEESGEEVALEDLVEFAVDATGEGSGLASFIANEGFHVDRVHFGAPARNRELFANRASEGYYHASAALKAGAQCPDVRQLREDLQVVVPTKRSGIKGRRVWAIPPKDERKRKLRRSPDDGDAFMLTYVPPQELRAEIDVL